MANKHEDNITPRIAAVIGGAMGVGILAACTLRVGLDLSHTLLPGLAIIIAGAMLPWFYYQRQAAAARLQLRRAESAAAVPVPETPAPAEGAVA